MPKNDLKEAEGSQGSVNVSRHANVSLRRVASGETTAAYGGRIGYGSAR